MPTSPIDLTVVAETKAEDPEEACKVQNTTPTSGDAEEATLVCLPSSRFIRC